MAGRAGQRNHWPRSSDGGYGLGIHVLGVRVGPSLQHAENLPDNLPLLAQIRIVTEHRPPLLGLAVGKSTSLDPARWCSYAAECVRQLPVDHLTQVRGGVGGGRGRLEGSCKSDSWLDSLSSWQIIGTSDVWWCITT